MASSKSQAAQEDYNELVRQINHSYDTRKKQVTVRHEQLRLDAKVKGEQLKKDLLFASGHQALMINDQLHAVDKELSMLNQQESDLKRLLELERRDAIKQAGTTYRPNFDGIVQGTYQGIGQDGISRAIYAGREYKVKPMGGSSIMKGTSVQMWFSGNEYHASW